MLSEVFELGSTIIDKIWPDAGAEDERKSEIEKAKLRLLELEQAGEFEEAKGRMAAIKAEAESGDKWTSRARPCFMYVIYILLLCAIPYGFATIFYPSQSLVFVDAMKSWFEAIPTELYTLFGLGYLGYGGMRTYEKTTGKKLASQLMVKFGAGK